jgi:hypothetical protein
MYVVIETAMPETGITSATVSVIEIATEIIETEIDDLTTSTIASLDLETHATETLEMFETHETMRIGTGKGITGILETETCEVHAMHAT